MWVLCLCKVNAQTNTPPDLNATGDQHYCPLSQINVATSFNIIDPDDTQIEALYIQISTGYVQGQDVLQLIGNHPNIVSNWNTTEGKLSLIGVGNALVNYTDLIAAVNNVIFQSSSPNVTGEKFFSFTVGDANYLPSTGHFYEYISNPGITWTNARTLAQTYSYFGLQGYLATITSPEEAQLSGEQAAGAGWIGGSDEAVEGVWRWMTGPEAGTVFWNGGINGNSPNYANWNNNEPNNLGDEDYAHITAPGIGVDGSWNDLDVDGDPSSSSDYHPKGFVVEYGGTPGDPAVDISASTKITVNEITGITEDSVCGTGTLMLEAFPLAGTIFWFDAATGGNQVGSGTAFTTPVINTTTTYYALPSVNGCLDGVREPVVATVYEVPAITAVTDDLICDNGTGTLAATATLGTINWYATATGGTSLATGNTYTTPSISTTTTYYVDAISNGCITSSRTPVTVVVQQTQIPTALAVQTFCDLDNAAVSDLTATGTNILWYNSVTGGSHLSNSDVLSTGTYYATQTVNTCESANRLPVDVIIFNTVNVLQPSEIPDMIQCDSSIDGDDTNGMDVFDLSQYQTLLLNGSDPSEFQVDYFTDAGYSNQIVNPTAYTSVTPVTETIYVRMFNNLDNSCFTDTSFNIVVNPLPVIQPAVTFRNCDEDGIPDGFTDYNLNEISDVITNGNSSGLTITYHLNFNEADTGVNTINPIPFNNSTANTIFARVENSNGCHRVSTINLQVSTTSFPIGYMQELETCDDDFDGFQVFDLTQSSQLILNEFPAGQNLSVHYYENLNDAQLEQNEILTQTDYINQTPDSQILYVRVESDDNGDCFGIGPHLTLTVRPRPEFEIDDTSIYCLNGNPIVLETFNPDDNYAYEWLDESGIIISTDPTATVSSGGIYTVLATSVYGCESLPMTFNVVESGIAQVDLEDITIVDFSDSNSITINNSNNNLGIGDYEFALDDVNGTFQDEPFFSNVTAGVHNLFIRDKNGCGIATLQLFVTGFPKFFTPNADGYNDTWNLKGWSSEYTQQSKIYIYDRYGKLVKQLAPWSDGWNGSFNGDALATTDFWFTAELVAQDGTTSILRGHFSLIR